MAIPSTEKWKAIASRFNELCNIPNCLGAIERRHITIQKLPKTGSSYSNHKQYLSIILMAACDADGLFTMIETGYARSNDRGGSIQNLKVTRWLETDGLNLPQSSSLPHDETCQEVPYFFVGDNAFPFKRYLLRPFPSKTLNNKKRICNYRFSRGTNITERTFDTMTQKFQVLSTSVRCTNYQTVTNIAKAACILHNFVCVQDGLQDSAPVIESIRGNRAQEFDLQEEVMQIHANSSGSTVREYMSNYFIKPCASLPWQYNYCVPL